MLVTVVLFKSFSNCNWCCFCFRTTCCCFLGNCCASSNQAVSHRRCAVSLSFSFSVSRSFFQISFFCCCSNVMLALSLLPACVVSSFPKLVPRYICHHQPSYNDQWLLLLLLDSVVLMVSLSVQILVCGRSAVCVRVVVIVVVVLVVVLISFALSRIAKLSSPIISPRSTCTGGKLW